MNWLRHPLYQPFLQEVVQQFSVGPHPNKRLSSVIFLCGGNGSPMRDLIAAHIRRHHPGIFVFYAEHVWNELARMVAKQQLNALAMEQQLAQLSDMIVILVESPGAIAELGAFSGDPDLQTKILPILDIRYKGEESFIQTGPVQLVERVSRFSPVIYKKGSIYPAGDLDDRIQRIPKVGREKSRDQVELKSLLFALCDLVAVISPASLEVCEYVFTQARKLPRSWTVADLLALACSLRLVERSDTGYYRRLMPGGNLEVFQYQAPKNQHKAPNSEIGPLRAWYLSLALKSEEGREMLGVTA